MTSCSRTNMADRAVAWCPQERPFIRKELQRWGKNVLFLVGLERVAEELMGGRKWKKLMTPFNSLETKKPEDWSPDETCYFCKSKSHTFCNSSLKNDIDQHSDNARRKSCTCEDDLSGVNSTIGNKCSYCMSLPTSKSTDSPACTVSSPPSSPLQANDQPLDLSVHTRNKCLSDCKTGDKSDRNNNSCIKIPQPSTAKNCKKNKTEVNTAWKRTYTEEELQAALRDIQSGKLGTRRAAVIYGIPRSTLRNKVYKLALDRSNSKRRPLGNNLPHKKSRYSGTSSKTKEKGLHYSENLAEDQSKVSVSNNSASESLKQILKHTITHRSEASNCFNSNQPSISNANISPLSATQLPLQIPSLAESISTLQMLSAADSSNNLAPLFSHFLLNIRQLALSKQNNELDNLMDYNSKACSDLPLLPKLIKKLAKERIELEQCKMGSEDNHTKSNKDEESHVILKVPSFKPKLNRDQVIVCSNTEKEADVDDIDELELNKRMISSHSSGKSRVKSKSSSVLTNEMKTSNMVADEVNSKISMSSSVMSDDSSSDAFNNDIKCSTSESISNNASDQSNPATPDQKRLRPKRGRYRNYNRDDLVKAVRAVQRGEMSVHRAGTLFGVPHSTLEYKVKERHLLRPRKRVNQAGDSFKRNHDSVKTNNSVANSSKLPQSGVSSSPPVSLSSASKANIWPTISIFPPDGNAVPDSNTNFFASNIMRKLQENAKMNEGNNRNDASNEFGGFLLESLIKSSLERDSLLSDGGEKTASASNTSLAVLKQVTALDKKQSAV